jgi:hypothetical protein
VVVLALLAGCGGRPALADVEPAMTQAVRTVVGAQATVHREVFPRCGPTDERLDGQRLALVAEVPPGGIDLRDVVDELRADGLDVRGGDGTDAPLVAVEADDGWTAELWASAEGPWRLTASAEVDGMPDDPERPCG